MTLKEAVVKAKFLEPRLRDLPWVWATEAAELLAWLVYNLERPDEDVALAMEEHFKGSD